MPHFHFPDDLLRLQHDWTRTYNRLAYRPATGAAELRADLFALTLRIDSHPHWRTADWSRGGQDPVVDGRPGRTRWGARGERAASSWSPSRSVVLMSELETRLESWRAVRAWLTWQQRQAAQAIASLEAELATVQARRPQPPPPEWKVESIRTASGPKALPFSRGCPECELGKPDDRPVQRHTPVGGGCATGVADRGGGCLMLTVHLAINTAALAWWG